MKLRKYQQEGLAALLEAQSRGIRCNLIGMPTGGGKGTMIAERAGQDVRAGKHVLILTPRTEITKDLSDRIRDYHGIYANVDHELEIMNVQKLLHLKKRKQDDLRPRFDHSPIDHVILDEVHHMRANWWASVFDYYPMSLITGFTATTDRADGKGLGDCFENLIVPINYSGLLAQGLLVPCDIYRPAESLGPNLAISTVDACQRYARGPTIVYEATKELALNTQRVLKRRGIRSTVVVDDTPKGVREEAVAEFKVGKLKFLINVQVFTEGVDLPCTETIVLGRGCGHNTLYRQIGGRGMRPWKDKKRWLLIDLTGTSHFHPLPEEDYPYELRKSSEKRGLAGDDLEDNIEAEERPMSALPEVLGVDLIHVQSGEVISPNADPEDEADEKMRHIRRLKQEIAKGTKTVRGALGDYRYRFGESAPRGVFES